MIEVSDPLADACHRVIGSAVNPYRLWAATALAHRDQVAFRQVERKRGLVLSQQAKLLMPEALEDGDLRLNKGVVAIEATADEVVGHGLLRCREPSSSQWCEHVL